ncbi:MAG: UbiA family prenyltransferase [Pelobium sp.]
MRLAISRSVLLHLRLPFSLLLLPVYLFALSRSANFNNLHALVVFIVLHLLIYPASNGYNSYFDQDEGSIALIKNPPKADITLYYTSISLEWFGVLLAFFVGWQFSLGVIVYNFLSKAYSHPSVRLKKFPIISFLTVFIFQGGFIYLLCLYAFKNFDFGFTLADYLASLICSCLIGATYPLTQVYQHEEDSKRGDKTLSLLLGIKGSFVFSGLLFTASIFLMFLFWNQQQQLNNFWVFLVMILPATAFFLWWFVKVLKDTKQANFTNMMRMTIISGSAMLIYFTWLWLVA